MKETLLALLMQLTSHEKEILETATTQCVCAGTVDEDKKEILARILIMERAAEVPEELRGMTLAAACSESCYSFDAIGDSGKAIGMFQLHNWTRKFVDRESPLESAAFWLEHVQSRAMQNPCGFDDKVQQWINGWVRAVRAPKGGRCKERPLHLRALARWKHHQQTAQE